ncbi:MAG: hypothetical protein ABIL25_09790 [candidate division WOR-3 bacterium]
MMSPKRQDLTATRTPRRDKRKQPGISRYLVLLLVLVAVVTGVMLVLGSTKKQSAKPRLKTETTDEFSTGARRKSKGTSSAKTEKLARRKREKKEKRQRRERRARRRKTRGRVGSSRTRYSVPRQLQMIVTNARGERVAVIDSRQYRTGDEVEGRKLTQVKTDEVQYEYRGKTYSARIGQQLY